MKNFAVNRIMFTRIAAVLAFMLGTLTVIAGLTVALHYSIPDYTILYWLLYYNIILGVISVLASKSIWQGTRPAMYFSAFILSSHALVIIILITAFKEVAAEQSIKAMGFRLFIWATILSITLLSKTQRNEVH